MGSFDLIVSVNDMASGAIDAADGKNAEIDLIKKALIEKLGPDAGNYFDGAKVVIGIVGAIKG